MSAFTAPAVIARQPTEDARRGVGAAPGAGGKLVGLGERRVDVDGAEDLVQPQLVFHGKNEFGNQIAGVLSNNSGAEDPIAAGRREDFDEATRVAVGNRPIEFADVVARDLVGDAEFDFPTEEKKPLISYFYKILRCCLLDQREE